MTSPLGVTESANWSDVLMGAVGHVGSWARSGEGLNVVAEMDARSSESERVPSRRVTTPSSKQAVGRGAGTRRANP